MNALLPGLALSIWTVFLAEAARRAEARISSIEPEFLWLPIAACTPIVAFGSLQERDPFTLAATFACIALVVGAFSDARTGYIFDAITFPAAVVTTTLAVATGSAAESTAGIVVLVGIFGGTFVLSRGHAIGLGDVKAMYAIGAGFGPVKALLVVFAASVSGLLATAFAKSDECPESREIRFGPHLAIGGGLALIAGDRIVHGALGL